MLVSVVIPTFNCADFLVQAIRSVLAQTYHDFETIVVDDASTDHTESALRQFGDRVRHIRQEQSGPSVARNRGILQAKGELIAFLDADDVWRPTKLARQVDHLNHHPETVLVYTDFTRGSFLSLPSPRTSGEPSRTSPAQLAGPLTTHHSPTHHSLFCGGQSRLRAFKPRNSSDAFHALLDENFIHTSSVLVRRQALARSGLFEPTLRGSEDLELWLRLARLGPFGLVDEILVDVRQHATNTTKSIGFVREQIRATRMMLERWGSDPAAVRLLRRRLGICSWNLAFAEQCRGHYAEARTAYWSSARHTFAARPSPLSLFLNWKAREKTAPVAAAMARAAFMSLPSGVVSLARKVTRRIT
jgi:glycosyltransferase involved in cell wall biosynthesis